MNDIMGGEAASGSISSSATPVANSANGSTAINGNNNIDNNGSNNGSGNNNGKAGNMSGTVAANGGERISAAVTKVLQGYDWTLVPVATK